MSLFKDFVEGVACGFVSAASDRPFVSSADDVVETCCRQLGWSIDERLGANEVCLHFIDPLVRIRRVVVSVENQESVVGFTVFSAVTLPASRVPGAVLGHLLERNTHILAAWQMSVGENNEVAFALTYCALASGLHPGIFKMLCETMIKEAHDFDAKMHEAGLL
jgi:hypothetical protein